MSYLPLFPTEDPQLPAKEYCVNILGPVTIGTHPMIKTLQRTHKSDYAELHHIFLSSSFDVSQEYGCKERTPVSSKMLIHVVFSDYANARDFSRDLQLRTRELLKTRDLSVSCARTIEIKPGMA